MHGSPLLAEIGNRVRSRRADMGWTLKDVAARSGVSTRFLSDLESGKGNISVARLDDIARALRLPIASLFPNENGAAPCSQSIALVGLRGAGKSTIGAALAKSLAVPFVELDAVIEKEANLSLAELFSLHGEPYYKRLAHQSLSRLLAQEERVVLAVGGSVVTDVETWQLLKRRAHTVWLKATPEDHWKRVLGQGDTRPMANRKSAMAELRSILALRSPLYAEAAQTIDTSAVRVKEAVRRIAAREVKVGRKNH
jgi:XRE family transcriptional regulator, aerobic/anaerobic benzoate catabolism transcriptional regulator